MSQENKNKIKNKKNEKGNAMRSPNVTDGCTEYESLKTSQHVCYDEY